MTYFPLQPRYNIYTDSLGAPLDDGYIYIGIANFDPVAYPTKVSWDESGLYPVEFPVRTMGGYPLRDGIPARMFISLADNYEYSILIQDEDEVEVYSSSTGLGGYFAEDAGTLEGHPASYFAVDSEVVHLAGAETVTGQKTHLNALQLYQRDSPLTAITTPWQNNVVRFINADATNGNYSSILFSSVNSLLASRTSAAIVCTTDDHLDASYSSSIHFITVENLIYSAHFSLNSNGTMTIDGNNVYHAGNDSALMHLAGAETVTGTKTFDAGPTLSNNIGLLAKQLDGTVRPIIAIDASDICYVGNNNLVTNIRSNGTLTYNGASLASGTIDTTATQTITVVDGLITSIV